MIEVEDMSQQDVVGQFGFGRGHEYRVRGAAARLDGRVFGQDAQALPQDVHRLAERDVLLAHDQLDHIPAAAAGQTVPQVLRGRHAEAGRVVVMERAAELAKRRGPRQSCPQCCQRHRGQQKRQKRGPRARRKKGDKSKNGKEAMVVVMYTLRRGCE